MSENPECNVSGCEEPAKHKWRFVFLENYRPTTQYCDTHSQARGETSEISEYLGKVGDSE